MHMAASKGSRQALIREILGRESVKNQEELRVALESEGIRANQATISRDCREMGLLKTVSGYLLPDQIGAAVLANRQEIKLDHVYSAQTANNLVVLKTGPGMANATAILLDQSGRKDVLGTVAGDDTIFVATPSAKSAKALVNAIIEGVLT